MLPLTSKLPGVGETIFTKMSVLAQQHHSINLGQGFPDFDMDPHLTDQVNRAMKDGHNQYAHRNGVAGLREVLAAKVFFLYQNNINPNTQICITPGATYAIYNALTSVLHPGDEVIVFEPAYDSYIPNIEINGAIPVLIPLTYPLYKIDWDMVREKITSATRMIILNSPHNPSGSVLDEKDIKELSSILQNTNILILSDEVYEHLVFDGKKHESILKYPDLFQRSFVTFSFGKVFHCTGWKMGYCIAPAYLMKEFLKIHQYNCFSTNTPAQYGLAAYLRVNNDYLLLGEMMQKKRDFFLEKMKPTGFRPLASDGSYFQLFDYTKLSNKTELEYATQLTIEAGVTAIPVSAFYKFPVENKVLRFCFAKKETTLEEAVDRLIRFLKK